MNLIQNPITPQQRSMIFGLAKDCNLSNDQLHDLMPDWSGAHSLKQDACTKAQADKIIEALKALSINSVGGGACPPLSGSIGKPGFITKKQFNAINLICSQKKWDVNHLNNFINHTTGKLSLDGLTMKEASAVITGLKKI
ncbi:MAG: hypothetical protein UZ05_CHB002002201 [Chlorobi bacterium OLB5]|nr:MAG: hypothetical protein UZ05_CHB002002201 [Chlorobi bacterium OLB5]